MDNADKIQRDLSRSSKRIADLEKQKAEIEGQLRDEKIAYQAKLDIVKLMDRPASSDKSPTLRPDSDLERVRLMLLREAVPLHVGDIVKRLGKEDTKSAKNSLAGSLTSYANEGRFFCKVRPNVFGLIDKRYADQEDINDLIA